VVAPAEVYDTECDVYSPCAVGGTLSAETIARLRCTIVGGSANNQLAEPDDSKRLYERGILYAPDFIINAGGIIQLYLLEDQGASEEEMLRALRGVGDTLRDIFLRGGDPADAAEALAAERIAQKRDKALA
jgi:glutamate dehydrogenase/leucine dehydrogenase